MSGIYGGAAGLISIEDCLFVGGCQPSTKIDSDLSSTLPRYEILTDPNTHCLEASRVKPDASVGYLRISKYHTDSQNLAQKLSYLMKLVYISGLIPFPWQNSPSKS